MLKAAVIGVGSMGRNHVRILKQIDGVSLVGVCDVKEDTLVSVASDFGARPFTAYQDLLAEKPDLVSIAAPTSLHQAMACDALDAGCHVFIEKPIAHTVEAADAILAKRNEAGRKVFVGHIERFNPVAAELKRCIDDGYLGDILCVSHLRVGQFNKRIKDTGVILDMGTHDIDLISYFLDARANTVFAIGSATLHPHEDHASIVLKFSGERSGIIETSWLSPYKVRKIFVVGATHFALADLIEQTLIIYDDKFVDARPVQKDEPLAAEMKSVVDCIERDLPPVVSGDDSRYVLAAAQAAVESYKKGVAVAIEA